MKTILVGECAPERMFVLMDPDVPNENEFTASVVKALGCAYPKYRCVLFDGGFEHEGRTRRPDLALVATDYSHWFVIEVELTSHSLERHVLPQVRAIRYGEPSEDCAPKLARAMGFSVGEAMTLIHKIPREVAVIANKRDYEWGLKLAGLQVQFLSLSSFQSFNGTIALELDGLLVSGVDHIAFGTYVATDRSLRFPKGIRLPPGAVQINDRRGSLGVWIVTPTEVGVWVTKESGVPDIVDQSICQLLRTLDRQYILSRS